MKVYSIRCRSRRTESPVAFLRRVGYEADNGSTTGEVLVTVAHTRDAVTARDRLDVHGYSPSQDVVLTTAVVASTATV